MALSPESVSKDVRPAPEELTRVEPVPGPTAAQSRLKSALVALSHLKSFKS